MQSTLGKAALGATLLASVLCVCPSTVQGATLFDQTLTTTPAAVVNPNVGSFTNCLAAEGCFGNNGLVDVPGGNLPDTLTFTFTLSPAEVTALTSTPGETGTLTMVASRDIGHKAGAAVTDVITVSGEGGVGLGTLFASTIDSCPNGERGTDYAADLVCGPNFHTDITATDFVTLSSANLMAFAADGSIGIVFDPAPSIGRLKIFSVQLQVTTPAVPEPSTAGLLGLGLLAVALSARSRGARGRPH